MCPQSQLPLPSLSSAFLQVIWVNFELGLSSESASGSRAYTNSLGAQIQFVFIGVWKKGIFDAFFPLFFFFAYRVLMPNENVVAFPLSTSATRVSQGCPSVLETRHRPSHRLPASVKRRIILLWHSSTCSAAPRSLSLTADYGDRRRASTSECPACNNSLEQRVEKNCRTLNTFPLYL